MQTKAEWSPVKWGDSIGASAEYHGWRITVQRSRGQWYFLAHEDDGSKFFNGGAPHPDEDAAKLAAEVYVRAAIRAERP